MPVHCTRMIRLALPATIALALVACSEPPSQSDEDRAAAESHVQPAPGAAALPVARLPDLAGEWRVSGIDGGEVAGDMGIGVTINGNTLSYEPLCLGFVWTLLQSADGRLTLMRDPQFGPQRQADGAVMSCAVAVTPAFYQVGEALDRVDMATFLASGGVELAGGGHSVILFRQ